MKYLWLLISFGLFAGLASAQTPSISYIDVPGNENPPALIPSGTGGYYMTSHLSKSSPDSLHGSITYLDANLTPQWCRQIKTKSNAPITAPEVDGNGVSVMINTYTTQTQTSPVFCRFDLNGNVTQTMELLDSANANLTTSPFFKKIKLANGRRIIYNGIDMVHISPQGTVDFARQYKWGKPANNNMGFQAAAAFPGTNQWVISGNIYNTPLGFLMKFQDTTLMNVHVYNLKPQSFDYMENIEVLPTGELLIGWSDNARIMHHLKLSASGEVIWGKSHKYSSVTSPGGMAVTSNGEIWMHGSITPGQAGGLLVRLSPTAQFIDRKGQFKLGQSHGAFSSIVELPNSDLLTTQRGYYENRNVIFVSRIHPIMDFYCFDAAVANIIDTTYAMADSATTLVVPVKKRFGLKTSLTTPFIIRNLTVTTGPVVCTPTVSTAEVFSEEESILYPNPATHQLKISGLEGSPVVRILAMDGRVLHEGLYAGEISVSALPTGLYVLEVPSTGLRKRFMKA